MTTAYKKEGRHWNYTATGAVTKGAVITIGTMVGVALNTAATGENVVLDTEGVHEVTRTAAATLTARGSNVYFTSAGAAVSVATGNTWGGKLETAVATSATTCRVAINKGGQGVV